jgi:hypothetical protein
MIINPIYIHRKCFSSFSDTKKTMFAINPFTDDPKHRNCSSQIVMATGRRRLFDQTRESVCVESAVQFVLVRSIVSTRCASVGDFYAATHAYDLAGEKWVKP